MKAALCAPLKVCVMQLLGHYSLYSRQEPDAFEGREEESTAGSGVFRKAATFWYDSNLKTKRRSQFVHTCCAMEVYTAS